MKEETQSSHPATFSIKVLPETFKRSGRTSVVGIISLKIGSAAFPDDMWYDFPVSIVSWWLREALKICSGIDKQGACLFMDGPFQYDIEAQDDGRWKINFIRRGTDDATVLLEGTFNPCAVMDALLSAADIVIKTCREKEWNSSDLERLVERYLRLNQLLSQLSPAAV